MKRRANTAQLVGLQISAENNSAEHQGAQVFFNMAAVAKDWNLENKRYFLDLDFRFKFIYIVSYLLHTTDWNLIFKLNNRLFR